MNDEQTLRTYGSRDDAYAVFGAMLSNGNPPDSWAALLAASQDLPSAETDVSEGES